VWDWKRIMDKASGRGRLMGKLVFYDIISVYCVLEYDVDRMPNSALTIIQRCLHIA
jgi:hypothetical protein